MCVLELVKDRETREPYVPWDGAPETQAPMKKIARAALDRGVRITTRWNYLFVAPPLCIEESDLARGLDVVEEVLASA